ncbi:hypothetical protein [Mastigocladopsis repens]|uniref:hypothetical protein n=1 Tax=Mastigocladopsis repens TaxID=221287 RepID=UPI00037040F8|nr:hypothetical protein [Mastigocladopsis repens]
MLKRDIQGKFALKNEDYRLVRSLRLTDETWKAIGIASECLGLTRADYLEHITRHKNLPSITRLDSENFTQTRPENEPPPCNTRQEDFHQTSNPVITEQSIALPMVAELEILRDRVLSELKLGKQAPGYKTAQKALNRFIVELTRSV